MVGDARLSTHDLTWRSTYRVQMDINTFKDFQLTTSHGGRRHHTATAFSQFGLSTHDLTWRSTTVRFHRLRFREPFNSRPHMEVDSKFLYFFTVSAYFLLIYTQIIHYISFYVLYFFSFPPYCFILLVRIPRHFLFAAHSH